ncbi:ABC transporter ATP-binding protein [Psychrobacillus soli]|uniref:ABC transporter ATP-binding protein n=1 Tax=Psychrobacillus soli TaxID=1543965 RepID=A0A544T4F0_9BACI|nr:ABC transporter ATP-binding protein [Psychrobacillus soli]TQR12296.1 ABC transporter ATP-binding protein [Psychrobacillus soli]
MSTRLQHVKKTFDGFQALKGIDLTIEDGEFVAIVGPSGCGKTTLLRLIAGFETPTEGSIYMNDELVANANNSMPPEKRNLGMVFQAFALWPHMKVKEQVAFPLKYHRFVTSSLHKNKTKRVEEMLSLVGLQDFAERMPGDLSGGQKQRVAIARALAPSPALLLMDEPLSSLDAKLRIELRNEIQTIHRKTNTSIVYVTHDQSEALAMADKIVVMNNGKIEQIGTPKEIYFTPKTEFVAKFIGKANVLNGKWRENYFFPLKDETVKWQIPDITEDMKRQSKCPIRPEQLTLSKKGNGIPGGVRNVLFQGREIHFTVDTGTNTIDVIESIHASFQVGDRVVVLPK